MCLLNFFVFVVKRAAVPKSLVVGGGGIESKICFQLRFQAVTQIGEC